MLLTHMHPEDVKAELRKRFRSVAAFERHHGLPNKSVTDLLRGYKSRRVASAIEAALSKPVSDLPPSEYSDVIANPTDSHREKSAGAK